METLPRKSVLTTLEASHNYKTQLELLLDSLIEAENQVNQSASTAALEVETTFDQLTEVLVAELSRRKSKLLGAVELHRNEALIPLIDCKKDIMSRINMNNCLIEDANKVLKSGGFKSSDNCLDFVEKSSKLGALPAVSDLDLTPNITFQADTAPLREEFSSIISDFGRVFKIGPVQITLLEPKPGALLIKWEEIDFECQTDIQSYRLQVASCDAIALGAQALDSFRDVYSGPDMEYLLRDLTPNQVYSFRVCCRTNQDWSAWSMMKIAKTDLVPFSWDAKNTNFLVSNGGKLARLVDSKSVLFSNGAVVSTGDSIQFTLLSAVEPLSDESIALCISNLPRNNFYTAGALAVSLTGDVYIDGKKKIISLPKMTKDSKLIFLCERVSKEKWRISIETGSKAVTYEWQASADKLFFAVCLCHTDVQVLVE